MSDYSFRYEPTYSDLISVNNILCDTEFFSESEIELAISLLQEKLEDILESSYEFVFIEKDNTLIGYSCYGFIQGTRCSYDLYWIAVDPIFEREGYGTQLLKKTESLIRSKRGKNIYIETSSTSLYEPTRLFYEKNGYKKEALIKDYYDFNDDKIIYSKKI